MRSEIRKLYFFNKYVIITPGRLKRPHDTIEATVENKNIDCHFCPDKLEKDLIIKTYGKNKLNQNINFPRQSAPVHRSKRQSAPWQIAVLKNKFPSVSLDNSKAYGVQEVIIETPEHNKSLADFSLSQIEFYLEVMADRLKEISKNKKIEYILQFKNEGSKAGASIKHSHSQIFATHFLPPEISEELKLAQIYKIENGNCPYCDILKKELKGPRKIYEDKFVGAFAPFASAFHYESWIFPKRHTDNIGTLNKNEIKSIAKCLKQILTKLKELGLAYNFFMHQAVSWQDQHFYIKIEPRDSNIWAGIELGSGLIVNSVAPEEAAKFLNH